MFLLHQLAFSSYTLMVFTERWLPVLATLCWRFPVVCYNLCFHLMFVRSTLTAKSFSTPA